MASTSFSVTAYCHSMACRGGGQRDGRGYPFNYQHFFLYDCILLFSGMRGGGTGTAPGIQLLVVGNQESGPALWAQTPVLRWTLDLL